MMAIGESFDEMDSRIRAEMRAEEIEEGIITPGKASATCITMRDKILAIPRRIEYLGGQRTSYVQIDSVLAILDSETVAATD